MDAPDPADRAPVLRFGPDRRLTAVAALLAALALVLALSTGDAGGRLIWLVATVVLAGYAAGDVLFWPRLVADARGLRVRSPFARAELAWADVSSVRADVHTRHGLRSTALEIDAGETLIVLGRRALGADPEDAARLIASLAPPAG